MFSYIVRYKLFYGVCDVLIEENLIERGIPLCMLSIFFMCKNNLNISM